MSHDLAAGSLRLVDRIGASDCEALNSAALLAQPVNTVTSLAYVVAGLIVVIVGNRTAQRAQSFTFGACLAAIGFGSVAFHGPQPTGAQVMHDLPIVVTFVFMLVTDANLIWPRVRPVLAWFAGGAALATAVSIASLDAARIGLAVVVIALVGCEVVIWRRGQSAASQSPISILSLIGILVVAGLAWLGGRTGSPLCDPATTLQLHGLWHLLSAVAIFGWWWLALRPAGRAGTAIRADGGRQLT